LNLIEFRFQHYNLHVKGKLNEKGERLTTTNTKITEKRNKVTRHLSEKTSTKITPKKFKRKDLSSGLDVKNDGVICSICEKSIPINKSLPRIQFIDPLKLLGNKVPSGIGIRVTSHESLLIWSVLYHQLQHSNYFKFDYIFACDYCGFKTRRKQCLEQHIRERKGCTYKEAKLKELFDLSEKKNDGKRTFFKCSRCTWAKTSRSDEVLIAHLNEHVEEEIRNPDLCYWVKFNRGDPCNYSIDDLASEWNYTETIETNTDVQQTLWDFHRHIMSCPKYMN